MSSGTIEPDNDFADPRLGRGFQPAHWPLCNGQAPPPVGATDLHERRCLEFLAEYYKINTLNARLLNARREKKPVATISKLNLYLSQALSDLEKVEDRYAPIGFYGEPVMDGVFYRDIQFVRPALPRIFPSLQSSHIAIPGLEHIPLSELAGPVKVRRFGNEKRKVDL